MKRLAVVALFVVVAACGGKSKTSSVEHADPMMHAEGGGMGGEMGGGMKEEHPAMPAEVHAFHERLMPLWHADAGPARVAAACEASDDLHKLAEAVDLSLAPDGVDPTAWSAKATALREAWGDFTLDCSLNDAAEFDAAFGKGHDAFHALIELLPPAAK